jgi:replicative DNA helicase
MADNLLPHNDDCEEIVLGIMLMSGKECLDALSELTEDDFYLDNVNHRAVFRAIKSLSLENLPIDVHTVNDYLTKSKIIDSIGGVDYLIRLTDKVTGFKNLPYYTGLLKDYALMRSLISTVEEIKDDATKQKVEDFSKFVGDAEAKITRITASRKITGFKNGGDIAHELGREIDELNKGNGNAFSGVTTGYSGLDNLLNGLQKGNLIVLAARPSVGKTALGLNIAYNCAAKTNRPVAIFSIEMSNDEIMKRLFANRGLVEMDHINKGFLSKDDRMKLKEAETEISKVPLYIDDTGGLALEDLVTKAKKLKNDIGDLALIVVDYIGKINVHLKTENKVLEIDRITGTLKQLAKDLQVPILALAQVNRHVEDRDSGIPELSNLKDSGSIEQDADQVMFIYNPVQALASVRKKQNFNKNKNGDDDVPEKGSINDMKPPVKGPDDGELIKVMVKKNRNGICDDVYLLFFKAYQRFDNPSNDAIQEFNKYYKEQ